MIEIIVSVFLVLGGFFALVGSIGLARMPDFFSRLHGPTKSTTLGVGSMLVASAIFFSSGEGVSLHEVLVTLFLFMTAPVSAHLLSKAALHTGSEVVTGRPSADGTGSATADPEPRATSPRRTSDDPAPPTL